MTWQTLTSTDYRNLLDQLVEVATSRHMATIAVNAGGTGYVVGDVLSIDNTGSTRTHDATIEVLAVGGSGEVTSARIATGGAYTVDPTTTTANAAGGGTGTGATFDLTFASTGWSVLRRTQEAVSATVGTAGTGYNVGDQLTVSLGDGVQGHGGADAVFQVETTTGGAGTGVATVSLVTAGNYEETPTNDAATTTGGGGSGCELTVTYQDAATQDDQVVVLQGAVAGAVDPIVGIKLWQGQNIAQDATTYNWALFGMTQFSSALPLHQQGDISPGLQADGSIVTTDTGVFVPLKDADAFDMSVWVSVTARRILGHAKVESSTTTAYVPWHLGLLNPLGTTSEYQYPLYLAGCTNRLTCWYQDTNAILSGLTEMIFMNSDGGAYLWYPEGSEWVSFRNANLGTPTDLTPSPGGSANNDNGVYPMFLPDTNVATPDNITTSGNGFDWSDILWNDTAGALRVFPTVGDADDLLVPAAVLRTDGSAIPDVYAKIGEIDGLYWTSAANGQSSEDDVLSGTTRYRIFQNGNRVLSYSFCAIKED